MQLLGKLRKVAEENDADIIAADFHSSANRDRGKAGVSSIEEAWERHFLPDQGIRRLLRFHNNKEE